MLLYSLNRISILRFRLPCRIEAECGAYTFYIPSSTSRDLLDSVSTSISVSLVTNFLCSTSGSKMKLPAGSQLAVTRLALIASVLGTRADQQSTTVCSPVRSIGIVHLVESIYVSTFV
jgi:hypothetical protein